LNGYFSLAARNNKTQILEIVPFEQQDDDLKKKLAKNNDAKMVLYNALSKKEYERIFMCKTAKDICGFARFNTIITCLEDLDECFSSKNYVKKFLRSLHPKWRVKITSIEESKDLSSLALDELIGNLKVHEVVMEKDFEIYRGKKERIKSIALKAKKESSDDETLTSESDDEQYVMAVRNFKKFFRRKGKFVKQPREENKSFRQRDEKKGKSDRKCFRCGDPNHLIGDCPKPSRNKDQKAIIGGSWSDSKNDAEDKTNNETCLMAQSSNEVTLNSSYYSDNASSLDNDSMQIEYDSLCEISLKIINKNKILKTKRDLLEKEILELNEKIKKLERSKEIEIACKSCEELKLENAKLKETQVKFVKFDKSANSLREMLNNQKSPSCKIGLGFDSGKASTSGTKTMSFVGSSAEKAMDGSTIKVHGSTLPGSVSRTYGEKGTEHVFSPPMSSRSDFVITRKKLIHNSIDESKKPSLKPSLKSSIVIIKYLVNISKSRAFWSLNEDILNITTLEDQYAVSIKEDTTYGVSNLLSNTAYSIQLINTAYPLPLDTAYRSSVVHDKESTDFNLLSDQEYLEEEVAKTMAETMEQYMSKTRADYGSGVVMPKIEDKDNFELKG
ncbi:zf-CCHC domain-containing protein, partial [Tanacetum coccineum]